MRSTPEVPARPWAMAAVLLASLVLAAFAHAAGRVAYVYGSDPANSANAFNAMLTGRGITVDLYSDAQAALATTDFSPDDAIIIGDDPPDLGPYASFDNIQNSGKPIVAMGLGGSVFLGQTGMAFVSGGFSATPSDYRAHVADPSAPIWSAPSPVSQINQQLALYTQAVSVISVSNPAPLQFSTRIARVPGEPSRYSLIAGFVGARCYSYWGYRALPSLMTPSAINLFFNALFGSPCIPGSYAVNSVLSPTAPTMDGVLSYGEWQMGANRIEMDHGFAIVMNDNLRLYLLVDVLESSVATNGNPQNEFWLTFDVNADGQISPGIDLNYALAGGTHNMRYQHYLNPAQWDFLSATTKSSLGPGFDCFPADGTKVLNINTQTFDCSAHQVWEIAIDLKEINAAAGQTIHMGLRTSSPNPNFADEWPSSFDVDFSNLISVHLASIPTPPHDPNANIAFVSPSFEVTQVVQNVNNTIPVVADKATAARVSVITTQSLSAQPGVYYLYGRRGGVDLPGSPLLMARNAPLAVDRKTLADTANFPLPQSWTTPGEVTFHAEAADYNGHSIASAPQTLLFLGKAVPVYWVIQENIGTANNVSVPAQATIDTYESYVRTVFPVPDVTFVQKPWTALGALNNATLQQNVDAVNKYYNAIAAAYWTAIMQNKPPPYALPQMIFGAANVGGGLSDPTWFNNGNGRAAAGGNASSGEGVIAHEFNHNLDRSSNGTWGRHVNACNASGPDPNWPTGTNPAIGEIGFDTRFPWQDTGSVKTVVPASVPDLMSYCTSGFLPTKWISPYRYNAWFASGEFPAKAAILPTNSLYISGAIDVGGTGSLDPAWLAPGMPQAMPPAGAYAIELSGPGIPTVTYPFDVVFEDVEGNALTAVPFNFTLPDPGGVTMVRLLHGPLVLAVLNKSPAGGLPSGSFTAPVSGPLSGNVAVAWSITPGATPLAGLRLQLQYSGDGGDTWTPVAVNLPGDSTGLALDANLLPMTPAGAVGRLRLLVADGLDVVVIDSANTFTVGNHVPFVNILEPSGGSGIPPGTVSMLLGQAVDVDQSALADSQFSWTLDGNTTIGVGRQLLAVLPEGLHTLTLTVLDADGATGSASIVVFITALDFTAPLDIDASSPTSKYDASTDGLLLLRYLFGMTGTALADGVVGMSATRTDPADVKAYLDGIRPALDIDGDGSVDPLTDGLLILRYLSGLRGAALADGAVATGAARATPDALEGYLRWLTR